MTGRPEAQMSEAVKKRKRKKTYTHSCLRCGVSFKTKDVTSWFHSKECRRASREGVQPREEFVSFNEQETAKIDKFLSKYEKDKPRGYSLSGRKPKGQKQPEESVGNLEEPSAFPVTEARRGLEADKTADLDDPDIQAILKGSL